MRTLSACLLMLLFSYIPNIAQTSPENFMRGIHIGGNWGENRLRGIAEQPQDYYDWLETLSPNWVAIIVEMHLDNYTDDSVELDYSEQLYVPSFRDDAFRDIVRGFKKRNLNVLVSMSLDAGSPGVTPKAANRWQLGDPYAYQSDTNISQQDWPWDPANPAYTGYVQNFWNSYAACISHIAELCEEEDVNIFSIGIETERLFRTRPGPAFPNEFKDEILNVISEAKKYYSGKITYQMHWSALTSPELEPGSGHLWEDLNFDIIGLSAYFKLTESSPTRVLSVQELEAAWNNVFSNQIIPLKNKNPLRKILFIEFGYVDVLGSPYFADADSFINKIFTDNDGNGKDDGEEQQSNIITSFYNINDNNNRLVEGVFMFSHEIASNFIWSTGHGKLRSHSIRDNIAESFLRSKYILYTPLPSIPEIVTPAEGTVFNMNDSIQFSWSIETGEWNRFNLMVSNDATFDVPTDSVSGIGGNNITRTASYGAGKFWWKLQSKNQKGLSAWSNSKSFDILLAVPDMPKLVSPLNGEVDVPVPAGIKWKKSLRASFYEINIARDSQFSDIVFSQPNTADTSLYASELENSNVYYWRVRGGNQSGYSSWSGTFSFTTIPDIPETPHCIYPPNGSVNIPTEIHIRWSGSSMASNYHLQLSESNDFTNPGFNFENLTDSSKTIPGLKNSLTYYWRVRCGNRAGQSSWSPTYSFSTELAVGIEEDTETITEFRLFQNYPNPFNPETTIKFSIPAVVTLGATSQQTRLILYDLLGREITVLINETKSPGNYELKFDAGNLTGGIYFYVLTAGTYRSAKKMVILK